jgi:protein-tyrosine phosphatase
MFSFWKKDKAEIFDYRQLGTDMHSHLIPGIDDGSHSLDESVQLIKGLAELGYSRLITTPHIMWEMYPNTTEIIQNGLKWLRERLAEEKLEVSVDAAAEYFLDDHLKNLLAQKEPLLTISDNMVLVEFSLASEPIDLKEILFELQLQGYQPVIAHPERYSYNERNKEFFSSLKSSGYYFQLNILSLAGFYGKSTKLLAQQFIRNDYYELAGTDLHNPHHLAGLHDPAISADLKRLLDSGKIINPLL